MIESMAHFVFVFVMVAALLAGCRYDQGKRYMERMGMESDK
jgi:hypothetical protein